MRVDPSYEVPNEHPSLESVLRETLGTIIFQDQVLEVAIAFAGFSVGEAEGLRRAMSRKRSEAAIEAYHKRFVAGARRLHGDPSHPTHPGVPGVGEDVAERVFAMVRGFSGFGFPKAHGAAFGLLAYQSTWLRVHYGREFLCSLLNEQPMGFYPPDALVHEAQRRGMEILAPDVNESEAECEMKDGRVRVGLGYVRSVREREVRELVAARKAGGRFRSLSDLASRAGSSASALELLAWSGACDSLVEGFDARSARRIALWQLGVATPGRNVPGGVQLALPLDLPAPPKLRTLSEWESMIADYGTTGMTVRTHPLALLRARLPVDAVTSRDLDMLEHGSRVRVGGLVVARQRPGTANGIVFVLLEDEFGTINLIVPSQVYERHRLTIRTEPLMLAEGKLERFAAAGGAINVLVDRVGQISSPDQILAEVKDFSLLDEQVRRGLAEQRAAAHARANGAAQDAGSVAGARANAEGADGDGTESEDFRAVAPPVLSFASGRRR
jgi:error-prone DNA polymerase